MITLDGVVHVTAREAAELLAPDVTTVLIANWVYRGLLTPVAKLDRANIFRYNDILAVEQRTSSSPRGRGRRRSGRSHPSLLKVNRSGTISDQTPVVDPALIQDVVYYVRFADRIKIGSTSDLPKRLSAIPHDELLVVEPGGLQLERLRQRQFAADLVPGHREWFHISDHLIEHVAMLISHFGTLRDMQLNGPTLTMEAEPDGDGRGRRKSNPWWSGVSHARR